MSEPAHKFRTLTLISILHAFTHVYQVALLPLYLPIQKSFQLENVAASTFLVTLLMLAYFIPSYPMGVLADRVSRTKLLAIGLAINALGFIGLAWAPTYPAALASVAVAGFGGSFFHPAATALIARLFPTGTGRALGIIGTGAGAGFFLGPIYAGWRATQTGNWRAPVLELGVFGLVAAGLFYWLAVETPAPSEASSNRKPRARLFSTAQAGWFFVAAAFAFSMRDFAGSSMGSLGSLFLQRAHGFSVNETGVALSAIFLASVISNPLFGHLSDRGRKRWTCLVHAAAAVLIVVFPRLTGAHEHLLQLSFFVFMAYGFFFMASYPMVEAAVMGAVPDAVRGRAFGLWITIGGLTGNLSHWLVGQWVEGLGSRAAVPTNYYGIYGGLAGLLLLSLVGLFFLERMGTPAAAAGVSEPGTEPGAYSAPGTFRSPE
jgi:MFS family permease